MIYHKKNNGKYHKKLVNRSPSDEFAIVRFIYFKYVHTKCTLCTVTSENFHLQ